MTKSKTLSTLLLQTVFLFLANGVNYWARLKIASKQGSQFLSTPLKLWPALPHY